MLRVFQTQVQYYNRTNYEKKDDDTSICFKYFDSLDNVDKSNEIGCDNLPTQNKN